VQRSFINLELEQPALAPASCYIITSSADVPGWETAQLQAGVAIPVLPRGRDHVRADVLGHCYRQLSHARRQSRGPYLNRPRLSSDRHPGES
jgi:hypothetical protein